MNNMTTKFASVVVTSVMALSLFGCGAKNNVPPSGGGTPSPALSGTISASGSTALLPLVKAAKDEFETKNTGVTVNVSGGGSFSGLTQVASGAVQIGNSDVEATGDTAKDLKDHKVAVAPFIMIVNKDVTVQDVTMDQLAKILRGETTNWKELGGKDAKITVISRQQSSGSRATIVATVLKGQDVFAKDTVVQDSNGKVSDNVISTPGAIGYVDAPYYKADKMGALKLGGVAYSPEAVTSGKWPIYAYEHMYTKGEPTGATKAFIDYMMTKDFQDNFVSKLGFIPVTQMKK